MILGRLSGVEGWIEIENLAMRKSLANHFSGITQQYLILCWVLGYRKFITFVDVSFNQDQSRIQPGFLGQHLVVIRPLLLKLEKTLKRGIIVKRNQARWDNRYLEKRLELVIPAK